MRLAPFKHTGWWLTLATVGYLLVLGRYARGAEAKPSLRLYVSPTIALAQPGGAQVFIGVEITGTMTEAWYCPEVRWLWPDGTESREESDCTPWDELGDEKPQRLWNRTRGFPKSPEDGWPMTVELRKAGKLIARQTVQVRVVE